MRSRLLLQSFLRTLRSGAVWLRLGLGQAPIRAWTALGLVALLPLASALDPSGSTEPAADSEPRPGVSRGASLPLRPAAPAPGNAPAAQTGSGTAMAGTSTGPLQPSPSMPSTLPKGDIADTAQLSPDGSSSIDPSAPAVTDPGQATALARREPLRLMPARPSIAAAQTHRQWASLSEEQRTLLAPFEDQWSDLPKREKQALADLAQRFPEVSGDDQERSMKRLAEWAELSPEDRRLARYNYRWMQGIERRELLEAWDRYQRLTPDQRAVLAAVGLTSNTAARHLGRRTGLAAEAAQPLPRRPSPPPELPSL
jgi:hypothetical protein